MMTVDKQDVCFEDAIEIQFADLQEKTLGSCNLGFLRAMKHNAEWLGMRIQNRMDLLEYGPDDD